MLGLREMRKVLAAAIRAHEQTCRVRIGHAMRRRVYLMRRKAARLLY
jgi:hypothetical protein